MHRFSAVAIFVGLSASFVASGIVAFLGILLLGVTAPTIGLTSSELQEVLAFDPDFVGMALFAMLVASLCAGYLTAWLAPGDEIWNACVVGLLCTAMGLHGSVRLPLSSYPAAYAVPVLVLATPLSVLGGALRRGIPVPSPRLLALGLGGGALWTLGVVLLWGRIAAPALAPRPDLLAALEAQCREARKQQPEGPIAAFRVAPAYPPEAMQQRVEGWVDLRYRVDRDGSVTAEEVLDSDPPTLFDEAALAAVSQWRYCPREEPEEVEQWFTVRLQFELDDRASAP